MTEAQPTASAPRHIPALDGLRGIAILAVFLSHFGGGHKSANPVVHLWSTLTSAGWMGVDLFFVLSGFLITGILYDTSQNEHRVRNFYARRTLRIFPLFYGVLFLFLALTPVLHLVWRPEHLLYFLYLGNMTVFVPHMQSPGAMMTVEHFWSLAVEEQFYLLWPFIVWHFGDRIKLLRISVLIMVTALLVRIALLSAGASATVVYTMLFTRMDSLICGGALALLVRGPARDRLPVRPVLVVSGLVSVAVFAYTRSPLHEAPLMLTVGFSSIAFFCAGLVYLAWRQDTAFARWLCSPFLRFFGRYSYGLYVFHGLLVAPLFPLVYPLQRAVHSVALGGVLYIVLSLGLAVGISMLSYHFYEEPILRLKRRFA